MPDGVLNSSVSYYTGFSGFYNFFVSILDRSLVF